MADQPIDPGVLRAVRRILDPRQPTATLAEDRIARIFEEETGLAKIRNALENAREELQGVLDGVNQFTIREAVQRIDAALAIPQPAEKGK